MLFFEQPVYNQESRVLASMFKCGVLWVGNSLVLFFKIVLEEIGHANAVIISRTFYYGNVQ